MTTVHLIANAHLDPIWLWPWQAGLDSALATCRSACDRLDAHPHFVFNRGEAWLYHQVERVDPELFQRIVAHIKNGRWHVVGGWWLQPDCNGPSGFAMEHQVRLGKEYFQNHFGLFPRTAYNVDSFGHAAFLPELMNRHGQDRYVMMRPMENEKTLPSAVFRWQGTAGGPEVLTYRIPVAYCTRSVDLSETIQKCLAAVPKGLGHTMCFMGVGDHGGGPTEEQIKWCEDHAQAIPGARLVFSTPDAFFDAVEKSSVALPTVVGELQMHAVGCYSVHRAVKTALRRAEHQLAMAETAWEGQGPRPGKIDEAWERVAFSQFHDTLGGTCLPSAYEQVQAHLGHSFSIADDLLHLAVRRRMNALPPDPRQRVVLFNPSPEAHTHLIEHEPWTEWRPWGEHTALVDEQGQTVPTQLISPEGQTRGLTRLLIKGVVPGQAMRCFYIEEKLGGPNGAPGVSGDPLSPPKPPGRLENGFGTGLDFSTHTLEFPRGTLPLPELQLLEDPSDTWSHGVVAYQGDPVAKALWEKPVTLEKGPLRWAAIQQGQIADSRLTAEWRVFKGEAMVECLLRVGWREKRKVLKLAVSNRGATGNRLDGTMGGETPRPQNSGEMPLRDRSLSVGQDGLGLAVLCPEVYGADGDGQNLRLTLLRGPLMAHHDPHPGDDPRGIHSDQGTHVFRFRFRLEPGLTSEPIDREVLGMHRPPVVADLTRGMPMISGGKS